MAPDSDGDGLPDAREIANGTSMLLADAELDRDEDGLINREEYVAGTAGNDAEDYFHAAGVDALPGSGFVLRWPSVQGKSYSVRRSTYLVLGFETLLDTLPATPPENTYTDNFEAVEAVIYRIEVEP